MFLGWYHTKSPPNSKTKPRHFSKHGELCSWEKGGGRKKSISNQTSSSVAIWEESLSSHFCKILLHPFHSLSYQVAFLEDSVASFSVHVFEFEASPIKWQKKGSSDSKEYIKTQPTTHRLYTDRHRSFDRNDARCTHCHYQYQYQLPTNTKIFNASNNINLTQKVSWHEKEKQKQKHNA